MKEGLYTIGTVSKMLGVHPRMLRIYEREGLVSPLRIGGKRYYREEDVRKLRCVRILLKEGINIAGVRRLFRVAPCWRVLDCPEDEKRRRAYYLKHGRYRMRIAFATENDEGLAAPVASHFRRAPFFTFVDLDEDGEVISVEVVPNPFLNVHGPGIVPSFIREKGADVIVAQGMGQRAVEFFRQAGVEAVVGASGSVADVLSAILRGERFEGKPCDHKGGSHEGMCHRTQSRS